MTTSERYALACALDRSGDESGAIVQYDAIYAEGVVSLPSDDVETFYVGYGSTLRNVGRSSDSLRVLREGLSLFSESSALRCFEALTLTSAGRESEAVVTLIRALVTSPLDRSLERFAVALHGYLAELESQQTARRNLSRPGCD